LIGLLLLLALFPVLAVVTLAVAAFSGRGPTFESAEYAGFQNIPFRLLRFRTLRTDGSGLPTGVGRWISRLHLVHLPGLINIVRGEMALFGPRPARREFAQRLAEVIPLYAVRCSVKPGILGWAQMHLRRAPAPPCEILQIGYDLYYIKRASCLLDPEILIRTLAGSVETLPATEYAGAAS
jgi:lipopolysaccharide/colanic/teichoic acid biosynthesis glycosyltransferase